jgi:hypothetical protein
MTDSSKRGLQAVAVAGALALLAACAFMAGRSAPPGRSAGPAAVSGRSGAAPSADRRTWVEAYLRRRANDPDSIVVQRVRYSGRGDDGGQLAWVQFREKNEFGATVFRNMILSLHSGGSVEYGEWEQRYLAIAPTVAWSDDPAGPP